MGFNPLGMETPQEDLDALAMLVGRATQDTPPNRPGVFVEVGSWAGRTAIALADAIHFHHGGTLYCVDTWRGSKSDGCGEWARQLGQETVLHTFLANVGPRLLRTVVPLVGTSTFWAANFPLKADLVFIDADHSYQSVREDVEGWLPVVRDGGILCGHDYGMQAFPGVKAAVDEALARRGAAPSLAGRVMWWWVKGEHKPGCGPTTGFAEALPGAVRHR